MRELDEKEIFWWLVNVASYLNDGQAAELAADLASEFYLYERV